MSEALVEAAFELASLGPTSVNCEPLRLVLVRSPQARERLLSCVSSGNYEKVRTAPITAIVAYDRDFFEMLPRLYPHTDARVWFTTDLALAEETALRNSSLQGAYFILALRAPGAGLRADVRVRRPQGRCRVLSRWTVAHQFSVKYRVRRSRPVAP